MTIYYYTSCFKIICKITFSLVGRLIILILFDILYNYRHQTIEMNTNDHHTIPSYAKSLTKYIKSNNKGFDKREDAINIITDEI